MTSHIISAYCLWPSNFNSRAEYHGNASLQAPRRMYHHVDYMVVWNSKWLKPLITKAKGLIKQMMGHPLTVILPRLLRGWGRSLSANVEQFPRHSGCKTQGVEEDTHAQVFIKWSACVNICALICEQVSGMLPKELGTMVASGEDTQGLRWEGSVLYILLLYWWLLNCLPIW